MNDVIEIPKMLVIYCTFKCDLSCAHCYTESGPDVEDATVKPEHVKELVDELAGHGLTEVVLEGGEPTLFPDLMEQILEICESHDIKVLVRTNGSWVQDPSRLDPIRRHKNARLELTISQFLGNDDRVIAITDALGDLSERTSIVAYDISGSGMPLGELEKVTGKFQVATAQTYRFGRAVKLPVHQAPRSLIDLPVCRVLGATMTLFPDSTVWACDGFMVRQLQKKRAYSTPLYLGTLGTDSFEDCMDRLRSNLILKLIRTIGHFGVAELAGITIEGHGPKFRRSINLPIMGQHGHKQPASGFEHICEACASIMSSETELQRLQGDPAARARAVDEVERAWELRQRLFTLATA